MRIIKTCSNLFITIPFPYLVMEQMVASSCLRGRMAPTPTFRPVIPLRYRTLVRDGPAPSAGEQSGGSLDTRGDGELSTDNSPMAGDDKGEEAPTGLRVLGTSSSGGPRTPAADNPVEQHPAPGTPAAAAPNGGGPAPTTPAPGPTGTQAAGNRGASAPPGMENLTPADVLRSLGPGVLDELLRKLREQATIPLEVARTHPYAIQTEWLNPPRDAPRAVSEGPAGPARQRYIRGPVDEEDEEDETYVLGASGEEEEDEEETDGDRLEVEYTGRSDEENEVEELQREAAGARRSRRLQQLDANTEADDSSAAASSQDSEGQDAELQRLRHAASEPEPLAAEALEAATGAKYTKLRPAGVGGLVRHLRQQEVTRTRDVRLANVTTQREQGVIDTVEVGKEEDILEFGGPLLLAYHAAQERAATLQLPPNQAVVIQCILRALAHEAVETAGKLTDHLGEELEKQLAARNKELRAMEREANIAKRQVEIKEERLQKQQREFTRSLGRMARTQQESQAITDTPLPHQFSGRAEDLEAWISRMELHFDLRKTPAKDKVVSALAYLGTQSYPCRAICQKNVENDEFTVGWDWLKDYLRKLLDSTDSLRKLHSSITDTHHPYKQKKDEGARDFYLRLLRDSEAVKADRNCPELKAEAVISCFIAGLWNEALRRRVRDQGDLKGGWKTLDEAGLYAAEQVRLYPKSFGEARADVYDDPRRKKETWRPKRAPFDSSRPKRAREDQQKPSQPDKKPRQNPRTSFPPPKLM